MDIWTRYGFYRWLKDNGFDDVAESVSIHESRGSFSGFQIQVSEQSIDSGAEFAVKLVPSWNSVIVWNLAYRREVGASAGNLVLSAYDVKRNNPGIDAQFAVYHGLMTGGCLGEHEKVVIVGLNLLNRFFSELKTNMERNPYDAAYLPINGRKSIDSPGDLRDVEDFERRRTSDTYIMREYTFRNRVLKRYDGQCAICRLAVPEVLEAAHKSGRTVQEGSFFRTDDGVCLCPNHHTMYDKGLIDIDFDSGSACARGNRAANEAGWRVFIDEYEGRIIVP